MSEKAEGLQIAPIEAVDPLAPLTIEVKDEVPEGGYGWICVLAVGYSMNIVCFALLLADDFD